jgi:glycosyltransferase involved in cell wall biosynthesis
MQQAQQTRLAVITTHPIQYYAPWFRYITAKTASKLKVFYLWNPAATTLHDPGFALDIAWDIPLLEGYDYEFVPNVSRRPGSGHYGGINNPLLSSRLNDFAPDAALLIGYRYKSMHHLTFDRSRSFPLLLRGDSHRLATKDSWRVSSLLKRLTIAQIFRRFAAFLYVGKANREYLRLHGAPETKLFFAPHAVDNDRFSLTEELARQGRAWRRELGISDQGLLIMFAGKFEHKKRPLDLLQAFAQLRRRDVALLFVGAGILEPELRQAAGRRENVFFASFQNQSLMPRTYAAADLFVLPSHGNQETWGLSVNEALSAKKPVIVSDHVGCGPDLVFPYENGLVFEAGNVASLTKALAEALVDRERLVRWGEKGRQIVSNYDFAHATQGLNRALEFVAQCHTKKL